MQDQPSLKTQRSEREWVRIFDTVLHAGEVGRGCGVFGKVESSGKVRVFFLLGLVHVLTIWIFLIGQREPSSGSSVVLCAWAG
jgi:hypothetical protein